MLKLQQLRKVFGKDTPHAHIALNDLSLTVPAGDFVTIIGSNGAGKSTLFNAIAGNFYVDRGRIYLDDRDITYLPEHKRAAFIGRIFQDPLLGSAPNLTIEENLAISYTSSTLSPFAKAVSSTNQALFQERLAEFAMGLEDRLKTKVGLLSGGQRQALTLLMSTLLVPDLLLLDEHTAALDPASAARVMDMTNQIVERDKLTTLMITHNLESALKTGNRTIMMDRGKIILDISEPERSSLNLNDVLELYRNADASLSDRTLLSKEC